jgi:hypothetical protein
MFNQRSPSTRPSPQGEGESSAVSLKIRAAGFAGQLSANQKPFAALSSPGGEETGEGERHNKIHSGNPPSENKYRKRAVQVRNAPVFAPVFTALRRGELLRRGRECGVRPNLISVIAQPRAPRPVK